MITITYILSGAARFRPAALPIRRLRSRRWLCGPRTALSATSNRRVKCPAGKGMTRPRSYFDIMIGAAAGAALSIAASPVAAGAEACPAPVEDHIPKYPQQGTLNLDTIKDLLRDYHQKYYDMDLAAVFESAQRYVEQNADKVKKPALVLDIDETSLTNWPNLHADDFGFVADGTCDALPAGPCGFNQWILKSSAKPIEPARKLFDAARAKGVAVIFITARPNKQRDATILNLDHAGFE